MSIATTVKRYLDQLDVSWEPVAHSSSHSATESARAALLPESRVAKGVLLEDEIGLVLAVIGANHTLDIRSLGVALGRDLRVADEARVVELFGDCEPGAVPPLGAAYGVATVWDDSLGDRRDVYFEGGDHRTLVHMTGDDFRKLMRAAWPLRYYVH